MKLHVLFLLIFTALCGQAVFAAGEGDLAKRINSTNKRVFMENTTRTKMMQSFEKIEAENRKSATQASTAIVNGIKTVGAGIAGLQKSITDTVTGNKDIAQINAKTARDRIDNAATLTKLAKAEACGQEARLKMHQGWQNRLSAKNIFLTTIGGAGAYYSIKFLYRYLDAKLGKPKVLRDSSRVSLIRQFWDMVTGKELKVSRWSDIILEPQLKNKIDAIETDIRLANANGTGLFNVLLFGPPGTGKTMIAEALARKSGLDFEMTSGARFMQLESGKDIQALNELMDYAEKGGKSGRGVVIFVDEPESSLLADRNAKSTGARERRLTETFLERVEKPSNSKFMFIFATNNPEKLDKAVWDRTVGHQFHVDKPGTLERAKMVDLYMKKIAFSQGITYGVGLTQNPTKSLARRTEGFSARAIEESVNNMVRDAYKTPSKQISYDLASDVITSQSEAYSAQCARIKAAA